MIQNNSEYDITQQRLEENKSAIDETRAYLRAEGFSLDETEALLESLYAIQRQLLDEVAEYDRTHGPVAAVQLQDVIQPALQDAYPL